jgi:probable rRNA maturation factor
MNRVDIQTEEPPLTPDLDAAEAFMLAVLEKLGRDGWDLSVLFCGDASIRALNKQFRQKDEATDVLSFPLGEYVEEDGSRRYLPGDIVISLDTLAENARYFNIPAAEELRRLLIHGILHLDGMDHATNQADEPMLQKQEDLLSVLHTNGRTL